MIRQLNGKYVGDVSVVELAGLSTDAKPTAGLATGSLFLEVDTGKIYAYDEVGGDWTELS